jgi:ligand-binding sensor domain-containing protein
MKKLFLLLLVVILTTSYSQTQKSDPYYVQPTDTVSPYHPGTIVRFIQQDKKGNIWMAGWTGIVKYDGKVFTNYMLKESLIPFHTFCVREMQNGDLWFGTVRGGAYRYNGKTWTLYTTENGLADDLISDFMEDKNGKVWIATDGGISIYDPTVAISPGARAGIITPAGASISSRKGFTNYNSTDGLCFDRTWSLLQDKSGKVWISTRGGVSTCDPSIGNSKVDKELVAQNKVKKPFEQFYIKPGVPFTNARCMIQDKKGIIWIGGADGLYSYNPNIKSDTLTRHMNNFIGYIMEDKAGNLWLSCGVEKGMALYKYPVEEHTANTRKITEITKVTGPEGRGTQIFESVEDKEGNIWFGTMIGPMKYNPSAKEFTEFRKR